MKKLLSSFLLLAWLVPASSWSAPVVVSFQPLTSTVGINEFFTVDILADIPDDLLGWGLDLSFDPSILTLTGSPVIGSSWTPVPVPDGDGLAGFAFPTPVSGSNVLLATLTFQAIDFGTSNLMASVTPGDLNEGFTLGPPALPGSFAEVTFVNGSVSVVPVPPAIVLFLSGILGLLGISRRKMNA